MSVLFCVLFTFFCRAQSYIQQKNEIQNLVKEVRQYIIKKDTAAFKTLFTKDSFNWTAVIKDKTQQKRLKNKTPNPSNVFTKNFQDFHLFLMDKGNQDELFKNVHIENDDVIGSVTFDYSFLLNNKVTNYGKEFWQLAKVNGQWKIISVMYSLEFD
ncbi:hypothetical protein [Chryseobacterium herbae]|uniref:Nuclear transport factor 2 family protein n=1 Tax=Chryseobacterium herbae TaxID=2976476 RepID=A0ABT2IWE6_9FLAO|nr:hypothetical protein [Chryseobacterium sp. pc1-10]MCT2562940.1 hypothetical protein [Chryseobacterium sp. pc1-10]